MLVDAYARQRTSTRMTQLEEAEERISVQLTALVCSLLLLESSCLIVARESAHFYALFLVAFPVGAALSIAHLSPGIF